MRITMQSEPIAAMMPLGDQAILIDFGNQINEEVHARVRGLCAELQRRHVPGVTDWVPAFASVAVHYNPLQIDYDSLLFTLDGLMEGVQPLAELPQRLVEVPVCYGGDFGPDLAEVASLSGCTEADVIRIHAAGDYRVFMIGFVPGFPYIGPLPSELVAPRKQVPRTRVPAGSVALAGNQTGIYPMTTPGGWQVLGRTPLKLFDPGRTPPTYLRMGDIIQFRPISDADYHSFEVNVW